jgi:hypothetical protein
MVLRSHPFFLARIAFFLFSLDDAPLMEQDGAAKMNCKSCCSEIPKRPSGTASGLPLQL